MRNVDVMVIGAGPAGLVSALLLAKSGVRTLVIEKRESTSFHPKARGLNVRTMEILRSQGLESEVKLAGQALAKSKYMLFVESLAGKEERRIPDDDLMMKGEALAQYTPCTWVQCAQNTLERLLAEKAEAAGAELAFNTGLRSFAQDANGVVCTIEAPGNVLEEVRAQYLLACDGAKSIVREQLGIGLSGRAAMEHFVNIFFDADLTSLVEGRWFGICFVNNACVQGLFLPVDNHQRWLLNVQYDPAKEAQESFTTERCKSLVEAAIGDSSIAVEVLSALPWAASSLAAPKLRAHRVFLVGDAGHILPPAGGFGLNLAVQDAHNLAWKLAGVVNGTLGESVLETYEEERLPATAAVAGYSEAEMDADRPWEHGGDEGSAGRPEASDEDEGGGPNPWEQSLEQQLQAVIGFQYRSEAVAASYSPEGLQLNAAPGTRFPHVRLPDGRSTLDLLEPRFTVVQLEDAEDGKGSLPVVSLPRETWSAVTSFPGVDAILVRPDGVVGAAGSTETVEAFYRSLKADASPSN